jgi:hypothetical protein
MLGLLVAGSSSYVSSVSQARSALLRSGRSATMKDKEWDPLAVKCFTTGSICEFEDGKARPHLGVVVSVEVGAKKGGAVYEVADAKDKKHKVYAKNMHAVYPSDPMTKPGTGPAEVLDDYLNVAGCTPTQLGIELELIELGWEVCAEDEASEELSQATNPKTANPNTAQHRPSRLTLPRALTTTATVDLALNCTLTLAPLSLTLGLTLGPRPSPLACLSLSGGHHGRDRPELSREPRTAVQGTTKLTLAIAPYSSTRPTAAHPTLTLTLTLIPTLTPTQTHTQTQT